jgi:hypothetical protein
MEQYYQVGYFLIRQAPVLYWDDKLHTVNSASGCFNEHLLDDWSFYYSGRQDSEIEKIQRQFSLSSSKTMEIRNWVDHALKANRIGVHHLFFNLETAYEYKNRFFSHLKNLKIFGIYLREPFLDTLIAASEPSGHFRPGGIHINGKNRIPEREHYREEVLGYDLIGIEQDGGFHTFYCHGMDTPLMDKLQLRINRHGLFEDHENWENVMTYINEFAAFEPVPWVVCKVKLIG